jgi:hypothetical protein
MGVAAAEMTRPATMKTSKEGKRENMAESKTSNEEVERLGDRWGTAREVTEQPDILWALRQHTL